MSDQPFMDPISIIKYGTPVAPESLPLTELEQESLCDCGNQQRWITLARENAALLRRLKAAESVRDALDESDSGWRRAAIDAEADKARAVTAVLDELERRLSDVRAASFHNNGHTQAVFRDGIARAEVVVRHLREFDLPLDA